MGTPILVVDDNPANAKMLSFLLTRNGYEVRTAADAGDAFAVLRLFHPRLIFMDLQLPGMDGLELTRRIKADPATRDILVVALTAYAMKGDEDKAREAGCDGYITKPIDTRALPALVARYLGEGRAEGA
jgi:two-component system, cell cycle response regulator DivK